MTLKNILNAVLLALLGQTLPAAAVQAVDSSFLRQEPYKKQKQVVDVSSVKSADDLAVVREAIDPIMRFLVGLTFATLPEAVSRELMTQNGRQVLQRPPLRSKVKRYTTVEVSNWRVCGTDAVSFDAIYAESLKRKDTWKQNFVFNKTGGVWRFNEHGESHGNSFCK